MNKHKAYHVSLLIILLIVWLASGWLALHCSKQWRLTHASSLQLSEQQQAMLTNLPKPINLEVYVARHPQLRHAILDALAPVKALLPQLDIQWINPDTHPLAVQKRGISKEGQAYLSVGEQGQRLALISPHTLLEALLSYHQSSQLLIGFSQGNGERALLSDTPGAWMRFYHHFKNAGVSLAVLDMPTLTAIPANIDLLIMADPQSLNTNAQKLLQNYIAQGGNLIYTTDTKHPYLPALTPTSLPISLLTGKLVDANASKFGFDNPEFQVIELLADHEISRSLTQSPLFAGAVGIGVDSSRQWEVSSLLWSSENSWLESSAQAQTISMNEGELRGPIPLAVILEREIQDKMQRIVVMGDSDLWSDGYFNTGGNRALAEKMLAYFKPNASMSTIKQQALADQFLIIDEQWLMVLAVALLIGLPAVLIGVGFFRWRQVCL